jgi:DeoR/GlpR family transcriptional regulator of sugar metabolism
MWIHQRHEQILALLKQHERLTTEAFAESLGVSKETIRRDLIDLEQVGKLRRVHGGAIPLAIVPGEEPAFATRAQLHAAEKDSIARAAAELVERGMSCFINAGSTTHALARALVHRRGFEVVTNSLDVARTLARQAGIDVTLLGGRMDTEVPATYGDQTVAEISRLNLDLVLFSPVALDARLGAMEWFRHEAEVARAMVAHARTHVLLADASKLGTPSRVQVCATAEIDVLITDASADAATCDALRAAGVRRIVQAP